MAFGLWERVVTLSEAFLQCKRIRMRSYAVVVLECSCFFRVDIKQFVRSAYFPNSSHTRCFNITKPGSVPRQSENRPGTPPEPELNRWRQYKEKRAPGFNRARLCSKDWAMKRVVRCSAQYIVYSSQCAVHSIHYTVYIRNIQNPVHSIQYKVYSTQYTISTIQYTV